MEEFTQCVTKIIRPFKAEIIDSIIKPMPKELDMVLKVRGQRIVNVFRFTTLCFSLFLHCFTFHSIFHMLIKRLSLIISKC